MGGVGAIVAALALLVPGAGGSPRSTLRLMLSLERRLDRQILIQDAPGAAESSERCGRLARTLSRPLRTRGPAGLAVGDALLRESERQRVAVASGRWIEARAAVRAVAEVLDDARRLR